MSDASSQISPVLLRRARTVAAEHGQLSAANAENYEVAVAKKIGELSSVSSALKEWEEAQNVRFEAIHHARFWIVDSVKQKVTR